MSEAAATGRGNGVMACGAGVSLGMLACWAAAHRYHAHISSDEYQFQVKASRLFHEMDADRNGKVVRAELEDALQRIGASRHGARWVVHRAVERGVEAWSLREFVASVAPDLDHLFCIKLVPERCGAHQLTFTIPSLVLNWSRDTGGNSSSLAESFAATTAASGDDAGSVHVRFRLGASADKGETVRAEGSAGTCTVEWGAWHNPLTFREGACFSPVLKVQPPAEAGGWSPQSVRRGV
eukprot:COSAG01_NODE_23763_length_802_cov_1.588905_1_plen_237_part_10